MVYIPRTIEPGAARLVLVLYREQVRNFVSITSAVSPLYCNVSIVNSILNVNANIIIFVFFLFYTYEKEMKNTCLKPQVMQGSLY